MENNFSLEQHRQELLAQMQKSYINMDVALLLRKFTNQKVAEVNPKVFNLINRINACRIMTRSCMENFKVGMEKDNDFLCITNHVLFSKFYVQYLEYRNEVNMIRALAEHSNRAHNEAAADQDMRGGDNSVNGSKKKE